MSTTNRGFLQGVWDFFCSLKLSIFLLICLAATSVIGTIVPQNAPAEENLKNFSEGTVRLFNSLNLFDMYHSWWFILLLYMLTLNLIACSVKRLPRVWKMISEPTLVMDHGLEKTLSSVREFRVEGSPAAFRDSMVTHLREHFANPTVTEVDGEYHLFAQKNPYSRLGVYVVHASIIIIFIGAIIGSFFGYKAFVNIVEGNATSTVYTRTEKQLDLGFSVRCDKFSVSFYDNGSPKEFRSLLSVIDKGQVVIDKQPVIVNSPLTYKGITFYQSSYGPAGDPIFYLGVRPRSGGQPAKITARQGEPVRLPNGLVLRVVDYTQDVKPFMPGMSGPAARLELINPGKEPQSFIVFRDYPQMDEQRGGDMVFTLFGADEKMYTGLQVAKDPGVWVVWLGCALMIAGTIMAFFLSHKRVWVRISSGKAVMGGTANKNQAGFSLVFDNLADTFGKR